MKDIFKLIAQTIVAIISGFVQLVALVCSGAGLGLEKIAGLLAEICRKIEEAGAVTEEEKTEETPT